MTNNMRKKTTVYSLGEREYLLQKVKREKERGGSSTHCERVCPLTDHAPCLYRTRPQRGADCRGIRRIIHGLLEGRFVQTNVRHVGGGGHLDAVVGDLIWRLRGTTPPRGRASHVRLRVDVFNPHCGRSRRANLQKMAAVVFAFAGGADPVTSVSTAAVLSQ